MEPRTELEGMERYRNISTLGEGTYGVVFLAEDLANPGTQVAVKRVRMGERGLGVSVSALREIKALRELEHPNIVGLVDVFADEQNVCVVYERMRGDLEGLLRNPATTVQLGDIKAWMRMALEGLAAVHDNWLLHRDIKPDNLLIAADGTLKLGDFGLARTFASPGGHRYSPQAVTLWYRAPEILFGAKRYATPVDVWAMGCVFGELLKRSPLFPGQSEFDQLARIAGVLGTPAEDNWPGVSGLPLFHEVQPGAPQTPLAALFRATSREAFSLLTEMLHLCPERRISAKDALKHSYFNPDVMPRETPLDKLPKFS
jgi:cyclin-dependent kinase 7